MSILQLLFGFLSIWWVWLPIVLLLLYLTYQNHRKIKHIDNTEHVLLRLEVPRSNDKKGAAAEQLLESLHGILRSKKELIADGGLQEHLSFEITAIDKYIRFYVWVPTHLQSFVEGQIYAQYPAAQIHVEAEDYAARDFQGKVFYAAELGLTDNDVLPIKTLESFEVDPLAAISSTLTKLDQEGEELWVQILARPIPDTWQRKSRGYISRVRNGASFEIGSLMSFVGQFFTALSKPPEVNSGGGSELSERDKTRISAVEQKSSKQGFRVKIRLGYVGRDEPLAKMRIQTLAGAFKQFNAPNLNGFSIHANAHSNEALNIYRARFFLDKGNILNVAELASLFHLPHTEVETSHIEWATTKTTEPPAQLPALTGDQSNDNEISAFASTNFRGTSQQFGVRRSDRGRHVYIIGQTGVGKSKLLELFTLSDIYHNQGVGIIDPHGDYATSSLLFVPPSRIKDVVYFNPADVEFPVAFNPLEVTDPAMKGHVSTELIGVLKRMFGDSWNPRLEYVLRYTILALLESPGTTMLDITRMLTDDQFRAHILGKVSDPVVRSFWHNEFLDWRANFASEAISPILNKVGAFTANPLVRNVIGRPKSSFNLRHIMDEGKIFVANLSRGLLGEDNAAILGALLVTKMQLASMSRANVTQIAERRPFYLYVDEFQNFATDSFAVILSEARKYGLNLTVANQYINQMAPTVRDAVFGNVGTLISFRVGPDDAQTLAKHFEPQFEPDDLTKQHNRNFVISMVIDGEKAQAFTGTTLSLPRAEQNYLAEIIEHSRKTYGTPRAEVEQAIHAPFTAPAVAAPQPTHAEAPAQTPPAHHPWQTTHVAGSVPEEAQKSRLQRIRHTKADESKEFEFRVR